MRKLLLLLSLLAALALPLSAQAKSGRAASGWVDGLCSVVPLGYIHPMCHEYVYKYVDGHWALEVDLWANLGSPNNRYAEFYAQDGLHYIYGVWSYNGTTYTGASNVWNNDGGAIVDIPLY